MRRKAKPLLQRRSLRSRRHRDKPRVTQEAGPQLPFPPLLPPPTAPRGLVPLTWALGHDWAGWAGGSCLGSGRHQHSRAHSMATTQASSRSWQDKGWLGQSGSGVFRVGVWPLHDVSNGFWGPGLLLLGTANQIIPVHPWPRWPQHGATRKRSSCQARLAHPSTGTNLAVGPRGHLSSLLDLMSDLQDQQFT